MAASGLPLPRRLHDYSFVGPFLVQLLNMNVGKRIRTLREAKGLSQADIEKRSGLTRSYVSRVEGGYTLPSVSTLEKLATALEVDPRQLFFQEQTSPKKFRRTLITTPFPSTAEIARVFGLSKKRVDRISRLVESVQTGSRKLQETG
jgi:DNA-binding XRE family transcriptional regulator